MPGIYLHIPFCTSKCDYCDFFSLCGDDAALADYVDLLQRELQLKSATWNGPFDSVFFGGGTPSRLTPAQVAALLETVRSRYGIIDDAEVSLEANPGTVDAASLKGYREAGINRISFGVQSFDDTFLTALGRQHSAAQARTAFAEARDTGFVNLSIDLIFALPGQQLADLEHEIDALLNLGPEHISTYGLTVEEGTPLHHRHQQQPLSLPDDDQSAAFYMHLHRRLTAAGYHHYEISNYALPGRECRHNLATWKRQPYLGVGAGAHSFKAVGWGERRAVPPDLAHYRRALEAGDDPSQLLETFARDDAMSETLYLALRTADGVSDNDFSRHFGAHLEEVFGAARRRCGEHLQRKAGCWRLAPSGWLLHDHLIQHFFL